MKRTLIGNAVKVWRENLYIGINTKPKPARSSSILLSQTQLRLFNLKSIHLYFNHTRHHHISLVIPLLLNSIENFWIYLNAADCMGQCITAIAHEMIHYCFNSFFLINWIWTNWTNEIINISPVNAKHEIQQRIRL